MSLSLNELYRGKYGDTGKTGDATTRRVRVVLEELTLQIDTRAPSQAAALLLVLFSQIDEEEMATRRDLSVPSSLDAPTIDLTSKCAARC